MIAIDKEHKELKNEETEDIENRIEENIEKTIKEMKEKDKRPSPKKTYKELEKEQAPIGKEIAKEDKVKDRAVFILLVIISITLLIMSSALKLQADIIKGDKNQKNHLEQQKQEKGHIKEEKHSQKINDIEFKIKKADRSDNELSLNIEVHNKSDNDFYITIRSMQIVDEDGNEYFPNPDKGEIPTSLFGRKILPKTRKSATIIFDDVDKDKEGLTLIVNNVSDAYNLLWDYMITIP